jgi:carboxylesterase
VPDHPAHNTALDYPEACRRIEELRSAGPAGLNPLSRTVFLNHGQKTDRVMVLLHGYTSSPHMYRLLARALFEQGMNVYVPLAPRHGLADRRTTELDGLGEAELLSWAGAAIDIAHGLGTRVGLAGFSMGGVMALWAARFRHDLDFAAVISPAIAYRYVPIRLTTPLFRIVRILPNRFVWWDHELKERAAPLSHGYPRYATHGFAVFTTLGAKVCRQSLRHPPAARKVLFILNPGDEALNNARARDIGRIWAAFEPGRTGIYEFAAEWRLQHDFIDPEQPRQKVGLTTPILCRLLGEGW